ncbi:DEAD/DEAH box helicase family protein [Luteolibacter pohnpeiensis]|uniref:DEAD/DEAH box helicase family protein n=1 Tax=Luteolibacter pohnpeiensis TaxID=454153 RepID=A0A934VXN2_9BACT|nr:DEAD/DEAH box helicase family protein [Luteolibacter pohnpeiensis]MBK1883669.1 DEAD/DEAH box helicase family protein [Luteolibacter pohnpeiensis]
MFRQFGRPLSRGFQEKAESASPSPESGGMRQHLGTPVWKKFVQNEVFQESNKQGIADENQRLADAERQNRAVEAERDRQARAAAKPEKKATWKSGIGSLSRIAPDGTIEDFDPETLIDDPEAGQFARQSLFKRDMKSAKDDYDSRSLRLQDPSDTRSLSDNQRKELEGELDFLKDQTDSQSKADAESIRQKLRLADERKADEQAAYDARVRYSEFSRGGIDAWMQRRQAGQSTVARAADLSERTARRDAEVSAAAESAANELRSIDERLTRGVSGADLPALQDRRRELTQASQAIAASAEKVDPEAADIARAARRDANAMDGKPEINREQLTNEVFDMMSSGRHASASALKNQADQGYGVTSFGRHVEKATDAAGNFLDDVFTGIRDVVTDPENADPEKIRARREKGMFDAALEGGNLIDAYQKAQAEAEKFTNPAQKQIRDEFRNRAKAIGSLIQKFNDAGITDGKEMAEVMRDGAKANVWARGNNDLVRTLSDGRLVFSPILAIAKDDTPMLSAIDGANVSPAEKQRTKEILQSYRQTVASELSAKLIKQDEGDYVEHVANMKQQGVSDPVEILYSWDGLNRGFLKKNWDTISDTGLDGLRGILNTLSNAVAGAGTGIAKGAEKVGLDGTANYFNEAAINALNRKDERQQLSEYDQALAGLRGEGGSVRRSVTSMGSSVIQMAPMFAGGAIGRGLAAGGEATLGAQVASAGVFGWAGLQGYGSMLDNALSKAEDQARKEGRSLSDEDKLQVVTDAQGPALINGLQTAVLSKLLGEGVERAAFGKASEAAANMSIRDGIAEFAKRSGSDGALTALRSLTPEIKAMLRVAKHDFSDEAVEEGLNQLFEGIITKASVDPDKSMEDVVHESLVAAIQGGLIGAAVPGAISAVSKTEPNLPTTVEDKTARVNAEILANDPTAAPATPEQVSKAEEIVGDFTNNPATVELQRQIDDAAANGEDVTDLISQQGQIGAEELIQGMAIEQELDAADAAAADSIAAAEEQLSQAQASGEKPLIDAAEANLEKAKAGTAAAPRVRGVLKIAKGDKLSVLTDAEVRALGITRDGKPLKEEELASVGLTKPLVTLDTADGSPVILDEALKQVAAIAPSAEGRVRMSETEARKKADARYEQSNQIESSSTVPDSPQREKTEAARPNEAGSPKQSQSKRPYTVTGKRGTTVKVEADTLEEAERIAVGRPEWPLGEQVENTIEGARPPVPTEQISAQNTPDSPNLGENRSNLERSDENNNRKTDNPNRGDRTEQAGIDTTRQSLDRINPEQSNPGNLRPRVLKRIGKLKQNKNLRISISTDPGDRVTATAEGILINPAALLEEARSSGLNDQQAETWISNVVDEEIRHLAQFQAAKTLWKLSGSKDSLESWQATHYGQIWKDEFEATGKDSIVRDLYGASLDSLEDWQKAMEGLRMMSQRLATGNPTEVAKLWTNAGPRIIEALRAALKALKKFVTGDITPVLAAEIKALENELSKFEPSDRNSANRANKSASRKKGDGTDELSSRYRSAEAGDNRPDQSGQSVETVPPGQRKISFTRDGETLSGTVVRTASDGRMLVRLDSSKRNLLVNPGEVKVEGAKIDKEWTAFSEDSGTLGIPRSEMPQIQSSDRSAMVQFLKARGVDYVEEEVRPDSLKPTQAEFSPEKVQKARDFKGGNRAILISEDNHLVDGHHQWMASMDNPTEPIRVIRLMAGIRDILPLVAEMPSVTNEGAIQPKKPVTRKAPVVKSEPKKKALRKPRTARPVPLHVEILQSDPVISGILQNGGLISKSRGRKVLGERYDMNASEWDDAGVIQNPSYNFLYAKTGGRLPNQMAQDLLDSNLLSQPTTNELWAAINKAVANATKQASDMRAQEAKLNQAEDFTKSTDPAEGRESVAMSELVAGDKLEVDGELVKVESVEFDEDGYVTKAVLQDGTRFGRQVIDGDQVIYVEEIDKVERTDDDFLGSEDDDFGLETQTDEQIDAEKESAKQKEEIQKRQDKRLTGSTGDLTADMFGEGDTPLFNERRDTTKPAATRSKADQALIDAMSDLVEGLEASNLGSTEFTRAIPPEKIPALINVAQQYLAEGINTPEAFAERLSSLAGGKLKPFSQSLWGAFVIVNPTVNASPDWAGIYNQSTANSLQSDATPTSGNLEPNRGDGPASDSSRQASVQDERRATGTNDGSVDRTGTEGRTQAASVESDSGTSPARARGGRDTASNQSRSTTGTSIPSGEDTGGSSSNVQGRVAIDGRGRAKIVKDAGLPGSAESLVERSSEDASRLTQILSRSKHLLPEQAEDVLFAAKRLWDNGQPGVLFTNGTGTGKTFTGLGVIKEQVEKGNDNILILVPSDKVMSDWVDTGKDYFGFNIKPLANTKDNGKSGITVTTYANAGQNNSLVNREWSMVVSDESHKLSQGQAGSYTDALSTVRAVTLHPRSAVSRTRRKHAADYARLSEMVEDKLQDTPEYKALSRKLDEASKDEEKFVSSIKKEDRPKLVMLSATPFAYHFSLDAAESYLFDYPEENSRTVGGYHHNSPRDLFYIQKLGYRKRYGKLTVPELTPAQIGTLERGFSDELQKSGAMRGRMLEVDSDYSRQFVLVDDGIGNVLDDYFRSIEQLSREADKSGDQDAIDFYKGLTKKFDYLQRVKLLEALKIGYAIERAKKHIAMGRKVVLFHSYNVGGFTENPVKVDPELRSLYPHLYQEILNRNPGYKGLVSALSSLPRPIDAVMNAFGDRVRFFNGTVSKKVRREGVTEFNRDGGPADIIMVQMDAGKEGVSLHDTTGKHQRVFMNIGLPIKPTDAIQSEGRIYRVGVKTDAIDEYFNTGTYWERRAFASVVAERSATAENFAMGSNARGLLQSFIDSFEQAETSEPSAAQGKGGKERDRNLTAMSAFESAKAHYHTNLKKTQRTKSSEGVDYYATPEPLGYKMAQWLDLKPLEKVLEPSAGHGAIARYLPETAKVHVVEPSYELSSRLSTTAPTAILHQTNFEDYHILNKFDGIAMNPPFGTAGKTAMDHVAKAFRHLNDGGRIIALVPMGTSMEKRFNSWYESDDASEAVVRAEILLPTVVFNRAATSVATRILVIDRHSDQALREKANATSTRRNLKSAESIDDFFNRIEEMELPARIPLPMTEQEGPSVSEDGRFKTFDFEHTRDGHMIYAAKPAEKLTDSEYRTALSAAKKLGGYYSSFARNGAIPGFHFKTAEARSEFIKNALPPELGAASLTFEDLKGMTPAERRKAVAEYRAMKAAPLTDSETSRNIKSLTESGRRKMAGEDIEAEARSQQEAFSDQGKVIGRPDLANISADPKVRGEMDVVDEMRKFTYQRETKAKWEAEGRRMADASEDAVVENWLQQAYSNDGRSVNPEDVAAAMIVMERRAKAAGNDISKHADNAVFMNAYREARSTQARVLAAGYDRSKTPAERNREYLAGALYKLPEGTLRKIEARSMTPAEARAEVRKEVTSRLAKIEKSLKKMGVTLDEITGGEVYLSLSQDRSLKEVSKSLDEAEKAAIRMIQAGAGTVEIRKATGLPEAKIQALNAKVKEQLRAKLRAKVAAGLKLEDLRDQIKRDLSAAGLSASALTDAEIDAELERILNVGFGLPTEVPKTSKIRRKKSKPITPVQADWNRPEFTDGLAGYDFDTKDRAEIMRKVIALRDVVGVTGKVDTLTGKQKVEGIRLIGEINKVLSKYGTSAEEILRDGKTPDDYRFDIKDRNHVHIIARTIQAIDSDFLDKGSEYYYSSILSGLQTMMVNATTIVPSAWEMTVGRGVEMAINSIFQDPRAAGLGEVKYMLKAAGPMLSRSWTNAAAAWGTETPFFEEDILGKTPDLEKVFEGRALYKTGTIAGTKGRIIRIPTRLLLATDEFVRTANACMEVGAMAYRLAKSNGLKEGTAEFDSFMKEQVNLPGSPAWQMAAVKASDRTFTAALPGQTDINTGKKVPIKGIGDIAGLAAGHLSKLFTQETDNMIAKASLLALRLIFFPFQRVPFNIMRQAARRTLNPVSMTDIGVMFARNLRVRDGKWTLNAKGEKAEIVERLSQQAQGALLMLLLAASGAGEGDDDDLDKGILITGSRPYNATKRGERELGYRIGLGPYEISMKMPGGKRVGFSYGRLEPAATVLGATVDTMREMGFANQGKQTYGEAGSKVINALISQMTDKTFLRGFSDANQIASGQSDLTRFTAERIAVIVPNIIRQPVRETDPAFREKPDGFLESLSYAMWPNGQQPARRDVYGEVQDKKGGDIRRIVDFTDFGEEEIKPWDEMLWRYRQKFPDDAYAPQSPSTNYVDPRSGDNVRMNPKQAAQFKELAGKRVLALVKREHFNFENPTERDIEKFKSAVTTGRSQVKRMLLKSSSWRNLQ